jgi:hypothetical protein
MDLATIEPSIQEQVKRTILPFDNLKNSVLLGVFVRTAHDHPEGDYRSNRSMLLTGVCTH